MEPISISGSRTKNRREVWTREVKDLLINWRQQININENEHLFRANRFKYLDNFLTIFDIISNGAIFIILLSAIPNEYLSKGLLISATTIDAFVIIGILITSTYNFGVFSQRHFEAAREYNTLSKLIVSTLSLRTHERGNEKHFVEFVRKRFETIAENSISLPFNKKIHQLELQIFEDPDNARGRPNGFEKTSYRKDSIDDDSAGSGSSDGPTEIIDLEISPKNESKFEQRLQDITKPDDYMKYQWTRLQLNE
jgi:hypothetical protein